MSSGGVSGAFDLTLNSGALATTAGVIIGVNTNALLTGAGNTRELIVYTDTAATTLNYNLTTSGGVTKSGAGTLLLGGTNTFTGGMTINQGVVQFTADNQLGAIGGSIRFGGTSAADSGLQYTGAAGIPLVFNRPVETTSFGTFTGQADHRWQLNGVISGAGGIGYIDRQRDFRNQRRQHLHRSHATATAATFTSAATPPSAMAASCLLSSAATRMSSCAATGPPAA